MTRSRAFLVLCSLLVTAHAASAADYESVYTKLDHRRDCKKVSEDAETGASNFRCPGIGDYTYDLSATDGRESVTFGSSSKPGMATFGRFNYANGTVEWRVPAADKTKPIAAIQRWFLADAEGKWATQILVVSKVGQPKDEQACVIGYVDARDGKANERARTIADGARDFVCGSGKPAVEQSVAEFLPPV